MSPISEAFSATALKSERTFQDLLHSWKFGDEDLTSYIETFTEKVFLGLEIFKPDSDVITLPEISIKGQKLKILEIEERIVSRFLSNIKASVIRTHIIFKQYVISQYCSSKFRTYILSPEALKYPSDSLESEIIKDFETFYFNERKSILSLLLEVLNSYSNPLHERHSFGVSLQSKFVGNDQGAICLNKFLSQIRLIFDLQNLDNMKSIELLPKALSELQLLLELINYLLYCGEEAPEKFISEFIKWALETYDTKISWLKTFSNELLILFTRVDGLILTTLLHILDFEHMDYLCDQASDCSPRLLKNPIFLLKMLKYVKKTLTRQHSFFSLTFALFCRGIHDSFQERMMLEEPLDAPLLALIDFFINPNTAPSTNANEDHSSVGLIELFFNNVDTKNVWTTLQTILSSNIISGVFPSTCKKPILSLFKSTVILAPELALLHYDEFHSNLCLLFTGETLLCESVWESQQISQRAILSLAQSTYPASPSLLPELVNSLICNDVTSKAALIYLSCLTSFSEKFDPELRKLTRSIHAYDPIFEAKEKIPTLLSDIPEFTRGNLTKINGAHILIWSHNFNAWECLRYSLKKLACFGGENNSIISSEHSRLLDFTLPLLNIFYHLAKIEPDLLESFPLQSETSFPLDIIQDLLVICDRLVSITNPPFSFICLALEICCYYLPSYPTLIDFVLIKLANSPNFGELDISTLIPKENSIFFDKFIALTKIINIFTPIYFQSIHLGNNVPPLSELIQKSIKVVSAVYFSHSQWVCFDPISLEFINKECLKILSLFFDSACSQNIVPELNLILELISSEFFNSDRVYYITNHLLRVILIDPETQDPEYITICLKFIASLLRLLFQSTNSRTFKAQAFINALLSYISPLKSRLIPAIFTYINFENSHLTLSLELFGLLSSAAYLFQSGLGSFGSQLLEECSSFEKNFSLIAMREISDEYLFQTLWYSLSGLVTYQHELFPSIYDTSLKSLSLAKSIEFTALNWAKIYSEFPKVALSFSHFLAVLWRQRSFIVTSSIFSSIWTLINNVLTHDSYISDKTIELRAIQANFLSVVKLEASHVKDSNCEVCPSYYSLFSKITSPEYVNSVINKWSLLMPQSAAILVFEKDLFVMRVSANVLENFHHYSDITLGWLGRKDPGLIYNIHKFNDSFSLKSFKKEVKRLSKCISFVDQVAFFEQSRHILMWEWSSFYQLAFDASYDKLWSSSNSFNSSLFLVIQRIQNLLKTAQRPVHPLGFTSLLQVLSKILESVHPQHMENTENQSNINCLTVELLKTLLRRHGQSIYIHKVVPKHILSNTRAIYKSLGISLQLLSLYTCPLNIDNFELVNIATVLAEDFENFSALETDKSETYMLSLIHATRLFHLETTKLLLSLDNYRWRVSLAKTSILDDLVSKLHEATDSHLLVHQILEVLCRMAPSIPACLLPKILNFNNVFVPPSALSQHDILNDSDRLQSYSYVAYLDLSAQLKLDLGPINSTLETLLRLVSSQETPLQAVQLACTEAFLRVYIQGGLVSGAGHINLLQLASALISYIKGERLTQSVSESEYTLMSERESETNPVLSWVHNSLYILLQHLIKSDTHTSKPFVVISCISNSDFSFGSLLDVLKIFSPLSYSNDKNPKIRQQASDLVLSCLNLLVGQLLNFLNYEGYPARLQQEVLYDIQTELQFYLDSAPDAINSFLSNHSIQNERYHATLNDLMKAWIDTKAILTKVSEFQ